MLTNGYDVAVIEDHVAGNPFQNAYSLARHSYYGGGGVPNAWFDGVENSLGGYPSGSMYLNYKPIVEQRIDVLSNFTVAMNGFNDGLDFSVLVTIENVEPYAGSNLVLQFTLTESHIPHNWGSLTEANHVNRFMAPDQNGTPLDFSGNTTQSVLLDFTADASWVLENCEFVAFVQDNSTKEILQAAKVAIPDLMPMYFDNAACMAINMVPVVNCTGEVAPTVTITNQGADALTAVDINYQVNDEEMNTFQWTGDLSYGALEMVELPSIPFTIMDDNDLLVYTTNPNGNSDEDPTNDTTATTFAAAMEVVPAIHLVLKLDDNPGETTWEVKSSSGEVLYSGGPYTDPQQFISEDFDLTEDDCYTFAIYDEGGDGLAEPGYYTLMQNNFSVIYENEEFEGSDEMVQFSINQVSISEINELDEINIYPNPFEDFTYVTFTLEEAAEVDLRVYNVIGEVVYNSSQTNLGVGSQKLEINTQDFAPGVYFVNLLVGDKVYTKKISSK